MDGEIIDIAELRERARRLLVDLSYFAQKCLIIRAKSGALVPLVLNRVQMEVHRRLEEQRAAIGKVRALILKARQPGVSTYVEARFFHRVIKTPGLQAFILTHQQAATDALFGMSDRFLQHLPDLLKPRTAAANAKELRFEGLDSGILVSTAGAKGAGRAQTIQLFHGSEVAHWTDAETHAAGVLQAIPDAADTEVVLESTANGMAGLFYDMCVAAEAGRSEYILIFIPWHMHDEYRAEPPVGWAAPIAFREYGSAHELTPEQLYWAWRKNSELAQACGAGPDEICWLFRQEYPATSAEAFTTSGHESYIRGEIVLKARKTTLDEDLGAPLLLGVDVARGGRDKTRIIDRQGRRAGHRCNVVIDSADLMDVVGRVAKEIDRLEPSMTFIDVTGLGAGVYDRLAERGYKKEVCAVNFGSKARDADRYANKRGEIWGRLAEWLADAGGADVIDSDELQQHLCAPGYSFDSNSRLLLEKKDDIRKRVGLSPDIGDALALTFAETVRRESRDPGPDNAETNYDVLGHGA
jgi:hypothetical protein